MAGRYAGRAAVPQAPRERLIPGNARVIAPSGRTTWKYKNADEAKKETK